MANSPSPSPSLDKLRSELARLDAPSVELSLDSDFEPAAGPLVKLQIGDPYWHLLAPDLLQLLESLPDGVGSQAIQQTIERNATTVWHGPAPEGSRDTSF